ncbi:sensor histidine kinase [Paenibacillus sp. SI8]|uniref:sensor histidine kinase n=1 Tax=unclassified Paenibacillus TaxID=185978 RepID=UPI0034655538
MKISKKYVVGLCVSIFVVLQIWCAFIIFNHPYIGIFLKLDQQQQWVIDAMDKKGAGASLDLQIGDVIQQVDGQLPGNFLHILKWRTIEQAHTLLISRNGHDHKVEINTRKTTLFDMITLIEEFVCLFMAVLIFTKLRYSPSAMLLATVFLTGAIIFMSEGVSIRGEAVGKLLITSFMTLLPIVFFHFLVVFFKEKSNLELPSSTLKYWYSLELVGFLIRCLYFYPPTAYPVYKYSASTTLGFFVVGFLLNMLVLTILYVKIRKQQSYVSSIVKSVWLSLILSFLPIICLSFLPELIVGHWIVDAVYTSGILLLFPISFAYLIASDQLYDIGLIVRRFLFSGLIASIPVSLFTGTYVFLFQDEVDEKQILFILFGGMILVTTVLYTTEYMTTRLEPFLFPRKHILQTALKKISKNLGSISSFRELKETILVDIVNTLQVIGGAIVFHYEDEIEIIYEGEIDTKEIRQIIETASLRNHSFYTCIEMNSHEEYTSYLIITRKKANTLLSAEETQWLRLITSYLEVSLENVHLIRKLTAGLSHFASQLPQESVAQDIQWFRKVMFELQEEERIRIASDLHDTTMQDLFFLKRRLVDLVEKVVMDKCDHEQLKNTINFVEMINASLRQSCFELNPHLLKEVGLIQTLQMYLEKEAYSTSFELVFSAPSSSIIEGKDLLTKRHIFRIVQELLNNAKKHSQASKVIFRITEEHTIFSLIYEDNGLGFDDKEKRQKEIGSSGTGIEQIRNRILHVGGQMETITQKGNGTKFVIQIPTERGKSA